MGIIGNPELLFLDEPTTGFDPAARRQFRELIRSLGAEGTTIVLTTHYLDEARQLSDRLGIIAGGRLIADGTADTVGGQGLRTPRVRWTDDGNGTHEQSTENPAALVCSLSEWMACNPVRGGGQHRSNRNHCAGKPAGGAGIDRLSRPVPASRRGPPRRPAPAGGHRAARWLLGFRRPAGCAACVGIQPADRSATVRAGRSRTSAGMHLQPGPVSRSSSGPAAWCSPSATTVSGSIPPGKAAATAYVPMRTRLTEIGGDLVIDSFPGQGTTLIMTVPLMLSRPAPDAGILRPERTATTADVGAVRVRFVAADSP